MEQFDTRHQPPADWWQRLVAIDYLIKTFLGRHIIGLRISGTGPTGAQSRIYSGCMLAYRNHNFWLTSGRVIDEIRQSLYASKYLNPTSAWVIGFNLPGIEVIPVHDRSLYMESWYTSGLDFGVVLPGALDEAEILGINLIKTLVEANWADFNELKPQGYIQAGFPKILSNLATRELGLTQVGSNVESKLLGYPIRRIPWASPPLPDDFWKDPSAFYGEILPYPDYTGRIPSEVEWMDGSPVFSIEINPKGKILYRLVGVQSGWDGEQKVRAIPIRKILMAIDEWM